MSRVVPVNVFSCDVTAPPLQCAQFYKPNMSTVKVGEAGRIVVADYMIAKLQATSL